MYITITVDKYRNLKSKFPVIPKLLCFFFWKNGKNDKSARDGRTVIRLALSRNDLLSSRKNSVKSIDKRQQHHPLLRANGKKNGTNIRNVPKPATSKKKVNMSLKFLSAKHISKLSRWNPKGQVATTAPTAPATSRAGSRKDWGKRNRWQADTTC